MGDKKVTEPSVSFYDNDITLTFNDSLLIAKVQYSPWEQSHSEEMEAGAGAGGGGGAKTTLATSEGK